MARACFLVTAVACALSSSAGAFHGQLVIHKQGTSEYHRPWCPAIRDAQDVLALTAGQAVGRGLQSHVDCEKPPAGEVATGTAPAPRKPAAPVTVYLDGSKYYHRGKCAKADGTLARVLLESAGKERWPCPSCRPPVRKKSDAPAVPPRGRRY